MKLKICGLKTIQDIEYINKAEVDYAGFVFTPHRQQISVETARLLKKSVRKGTLTVGVFVDEPYSFIKSIVDEGIIDLVQFHGITEYALPCQTIKAYRMRTAADIRPTNCDYVLFDSFKTGEKGSSGEMFNWQLIKNYCEKPFFLAGGINISNIKKAMELNPFCIDISSGAEKNGEKSLEKIMEIAYECNMQRSFP